MMGRNRSYLGSSGHAAQILTQVESSMILQCHHMLAHIKMREGSWAARKPSGSFLCASLFKMLVPTSPDMICSLITCQTVWLNSYTMASGYQTYRDNPNT